MNHTTLLLLLSLLCTLSLEALPSRWRIVSGKVFFKSETDLENIYGEGESIVGFLDLSSKKIKIEIGLDSIQTGNKLQTSHLHENYFETQKYPLSSFEGNVTEVKENGDVTATGSLTLHGITKQNVTITGKMEKSSKGIEQVSYFSIILNDYQIEVPKLVFLKVNPVIQVKVKILWEMQ